MTQSWPTAPFKHLVPGRDYVVARGFADFDRGQHPVGQRWTFIGSSFLPYDDGLSLFALINGQRSHIRVQRREEEQGPVIDALQDYLQAARYGASWSFSISAHPRDGGDLVKYLPFPIPAVAGMSGRQGAQFTARPSPISPAPARSKCPACSPAGR